MKVAVSKCGVKANRQKFDLHHFCIKISPTLKNPFILFTKNLLHNEFCHSIYRTERIIQNNFRIALYNISCYRFLEIFLWKDA